MDLDREALFQATDGRATPDEFWDTPMRQEWNLDDAIGYSQFDSRCPKIMDAAWAVVTHNQQPDRTPLIREAPDSFQQGKRPFR